VSFVFELARLGSHRGGTIQGEGAYNGCVSNYATAPELSPPELSAWRGFLRAHTALTRELDAELVAAHGLPITSYEVLLFLADAPEGRMRMSELAASVLLSRSGLTRLADRLAGEGLIERTRCTEDARGWFAAITPKGRELFQEARHTHLDGVRRLFVASFSRDELSALGASLERLVPAG
jgi:DNA-binding MarR family transcriptional regulator